MPCVASSSMFVCSTATARHELPTLLHGTGRSLLPDYACALAGPAALQSPRSKSTSCAEAAPSPVLTWKAKGAALGSNRHRNNTTNRDATHAHAYALVYMREGGRAAAGT